MNIVATQPEISGVEFLMVDPVNSIFPDHLLLVPQLNEVYELQLAFYESKALTDDEILRNGAYFARVGDTFTRHFLMCRGEPLRLAEHSSSRLKAFFSTNQFKTGYATHGLFPYRGKFHPQMIKAILNVMGLKPGDTVLDPMMGSGTVLIEASVMGINSYGIDKSPFCSFMCQGKLNGLILPTSEVKAALADSRRVFDYLKNGIPNEKDHWRLEESEQLGLFDVGQDRQAAISTAMPESIRKQSVYEYVLLAFLDSMGYAERSKRKSPFEMFESILERYLFVAEKFQRVTEGLESELGWSKPECGDARELAFEDESIDGIIFSPPYSFAVDYLENDEFHLRFLGIDSNELRGGMVGLRGSRQIDQYHNYLEDMEKVISECARVLKKGSLCVIIVGTNNNQLSKILRVDPKDVMGIDEMLVETAKKHHFGLIRKIERQITGMANTMRTEFIVILQKT